MLTLSLNILPEDRKLSLQVNENQVILNTLSVLNEKGLLSDDIITGKGPVKSERSRERINPLLTYSQAGIHTGDTLYVGDSLKKAEESE